MRSFHKHPLRCLFAVSLLAVIGCSAVPGAITSTERTITVLYTNDEHGWMEGVTPGQGAANLYDLWLTQEGYYPEGPFLILSGGDNWMGPAVSTTVEGESMVQVMNAMHYAASAVGNHEFDFGLDVMQERIAEADFPYLSANTFRRDTKQVPTDLGIEPFTVVDVQGLRIGIIGLTTTSTPRTTNPTNVESLEFGDYEQALRATVPVVRSAGIDLLFVIAHVCMVPIRQLAALLDDLEIQMMGAGHCNELAAEQINDTVILGGGSHLTSYARASFQYDLNNRHLSGVDFSVHQNQAGAPDPDIAAIVQYWQQQAEAAMSVVIGFSAAAVDRRDPSLQQTFIDSWLLADATADVAISNGGGIRSALPAGPVTAGSVFGMLPFDNTIIATSLSGATLKQVLAAGTSPQVAGLLPTTSNWVEKKTGAVLEDKKLYRVLVNSFMYAGGDNYEGIAAADPEGFDTGISYRQPFVDWIKAQNSKASSPLQLQ